MFVSLRARSGLNDLHRVAPDPAPVDLLAHDELDPGRDAVRPHDDCIDADVLRAEPNPGLDSWSPRLRVDGQRKAVEFDFFRVSDWSGPAVAMNFSKR